LYIYISYDEGIDFPLVRWLEGTRENVYYENERKPSENVKTIRKCGCYELILRLHNPYDILLSGRGGGPKKTIKVIAWPAL
jgi:hypothetical protein